MSAAAVDFKIDLRPLESLLPHEETIPLHVERLASQIEKDGVQRDPLVVDRDSGTILDGMHRRAALQRVGAESAVCCLVDYSSPSISLSRWARVIPVPTRSLTDQLLAEAGFIRKVSVSEAFAYVDGAEPGVAVLTQGDCLAPAERPASTWDAFDMVRKLDNVARTVGWKEEFVAEDDVDVALQTEGNAVVLCPRIGKSDVVAAARQGRLLPFKTTMHVIDPRPVGVNFPLEELRSPKASSSQLRELITREPRLLPAGTVYGGRKYKERLLTFSQD